MSKENALFPEVKDAIAFDALWQQAHEKVTALSGEIWTDTGDHDPGVTLLQSATWNCSDLSYRASLSLNDLLTHQDQSTLFPEEFGPEQVLTCNTVTAEDYRRALLDVHSSDIDTLDTPEQDFLFSDVSLIQEPEERRFHWWYNAEKREYSFTEPTVTQPEDKETLSLRGNLWLSVVPTRYTQSLSPENRAAVEQHLADFLAAHRNLGEAVSRIIYLQPATFSPRMTIELADNISDINQVAAHIYQVTDAFLRPTVARYTTEQRRALDDADDAIFEGPRLKHGWQQTAPSQITSGGYALNLGPLVNLLLDIPGVASLSTLSVDADDEHISAVEGGSWRWQVADGYYPLLWGEDPRDLLASRNGPLILVSKGGIYNPLNSEAIAGYLTPEELIETAPTVLPTGRVRDQNAYIPVGQRLPECYSLQQPDAVIDDPTRAVHQFLLPVDQLLADGTAELALLPKLLAFKERGDTVRGTRWPYANTMVQQEIHQPYAEALKESAQQDVAIFTEDNQPNGGNFSRELDFLQYLLGYFGTQRAALPLTLDLPDFLATQRAYLAQQPALGYDRTNIRIDRVSALQKRIAARIGLDSICFADNPDLGQLPFYLIEHRQLLPQTPDNTFDSEHTPTVFTVDEPNITLTQAGSAGKVVQGQLIDLIAIEGNSRLHVSRLLVIKAEGDSFTISTENSQQLLNNLERLTNAFPEGKLRWQNSNVWLQDMDYRLNYGQSTQPLPDNQRLLASNAQSPYPAMVSVGDGIVIRPAGLQFSQLGAKAYRAPMVDADWQLAAVVKAVDPIAGTLLIEKAADSETDFPTEETSFRYQWAFSQSNYATTDRFSFVVSAVLNRRLIESPNIVPDQLVAWVQETIMAEFPAHISLINHWFDDSTFNNFGATYARWQNSGMPLGDDAFALMQMLTLGHLPVTQLEIGLMRIATEAQRTEVVGDGSQWNEDVLLREELFYVPQDVPTTF
uniref:AfpX12 n=1 Tax=Serratia proteamaculans TaxID=28151 RepID=A0A2R2Q2I1_SERPR|nr:hypothetical protein [Serratia proteamaculans]ANV21611.1 AfpX12 [Serratia proteamaculans]ULG13370.1 hypothetical protein AGR96Xp_00117 [Serratia proteamaculans]ULG13583.1 hypothetical protein 1Ap1_00090 [Serratia proteamaculans]ULG17195.1 hypothetical protein 20093p_00001 [Serratia proteamaculans]ULG18083.1 hypothetical protein LCp1_00001 [Serratia proteamaculans]